MPSSMPMLLFLQVESGCWGVGWAVGVPLEGLASLLEGAWPPRGPFGLKNHPQPPGDSRSYRGPEFLVAVLGLVSWGDLSGFGGGI